MARTKDLIQAAKVGDLSVFQALTIGEDIDSHEDKDQNTPLSLAAGCGHKEIVMLLVERHNANINARNKRDDTPLSRAAYDGREDIVEMLLQYVNRIDSESYERAIFIAARYGHMDTLKLLIQTSYVDSIGIILMGGEEPKPNNSMDSGTGFNLGAACQRALSAAARAGQEAVVEFLLQQKNIDINASDQYGDKILHLAVAAGKSGVVELLLENPDIDINADNRCGDKALHIAVKAVQRDVLKLLLRKTGIDINAGDSFGYKALYLAAKKGHSAMVDLLLTKSDIDINARCGLEGFTALYRAVEAGSRDAVELLLKRDEIDINARVGWGTTPLHRAAEQGQMEMVQLLLAKGKIDLNVQDGSGATALKRALYRGRNDIVKLLFSRNDLDLAMNHFSSHESIRQAAHNNHYDLMEFLLARELTSCDGRTPITWCAENNQTEALLILLTRADTDDADANSKDGDGRTPLSLSAENGHDQVVQIMLQHYADANIKDADGRTPLWWAAQNGHEQVVKQLAPLDTGTLLVLTQEGKQAAINLLSRCKPKFNQANGCGQTPLHLAVLLGHRGIAKDLILNGADTSPKDNDNMTPLQLAMSGRNGPLIEDLLLNKAYTKGIMAREWRNAYNKEEQDILLLSKTTDGQQYLEFPETFLPVTTISMPPTKIQTQLYTVWLQAPITTFVLEPELNKLQTGRIGRYEQLESKGRNPEIINFLARDAQKLAELRIDLVGQINEAERFIREYCLHYNANQIPKGLIELLKHDIELEINKKIQELDQTVRDLLQIEFAWITVIETKISTKLGQNVMLLTYVSIFYLPLGFCAALWAIPNISDTSTRTPFIVIAAIVSLVTLLVTFNMEKIAATVHKGYQFGRNCFLKEWKDKKKTQNSKLP
ncbi:ankyrin repeat-containing domain protein [Trichoderma barbatum]